MASPLASDLPKIDRYDVVRPLGHGGMAVVYEARHRITGRRVAIKLLKSELAADEELTERFFNEARAAAVLGHPNIVQCLDAGHAETGEAYLVLEYIEGSSLAAELQRVGFLPPPRTLKIALQVADALVVAHANGVLHRDLKPDNIFLSQLPGESDHATVLDFGMSRFRSEASKLRTRVGAIMGTPAYMAPEQLIDTSSVDARADIYGLGVTLYEVLTGKVPFEARSLMALTTRVAREPPPPLEELRPGLPPALCKAVVRALAKSPDDRFPDMAAFRQALQACAGMAEVDLDATFVHDGPPPERTMIVAPDQDQAKTGLLVVEDLLRSGKGAFDGEIPALERTRLVTEPAVERPRARAFEEMLARDEPIGLERTRIATEPAAPRPDPKILEASRRGQPPPSALAKRSARVQTRMIVGVVLGAGAVLLALIGLDILGKRLTRGSASPPVDPPPSSAGR